MRHFIRIGIFFGLTISASGQSELTIYDRFDDFEEVYLKNLDPEVTYVVNFWATWCVPCVKELPYFERLNADYKNEKIKVVLVSLDFEDQIDSQLRPYIKKHKLKSEIVLLTDGHQNEWIERVDPNWSGAIPITLMFKNGERMSYQKQYETYEDLLKDVNRKK
ncbi:TlpA family protein disulfide reductase [Crocinitomix catalasitica]|nr:TlpA family protein disulfide reductase [Crocinitomix catalasitica]